MSTFTHSYLATLGKITTADVKNRFRDVDPTTIKSMEEVYKDYLEDVIYANSYYAIMDGNTHMELPEVANEAKALLDDLRNTYPEIFL